MTPQPVMRVGAMHDMLYDCQMKSGSELRSLLRNGACICDYVPKAAYDIYVREIEQGNGPVTVNKLECAILSRLRMLPFDVFAALPDASEGLERKLYRACRRETSLEKVYDTVKSKRYTHARIRRMTMCAALGVHAADYEKDNLYARVLALNEKGARVLKLSEKQRTIDIISKPAAARELSAECLEMFSKGADAHDLFVLAFDAESARRGELDWTTSPVFVK